MSSTEAMCLFVKILEEEDAGWFLKASNYLAEPVIDVQMNYHSGYRILLGVLELILVSGMCEWVFNKVSFGLVSAEQRLEDYGAVGTELRDMTRDILATQAPLWG